MSMERAYDRHDLNKFFATIRNKHVLYRPSTNIDGKVTCRNGEEYIEKPYNEHGNIEELRQESRLVRQRQYLDCGHGSSVTAAYKTLGRITLDAKSLTLEVFNNFDKSHEREIVAMNMKKWRSVFPAVRLQNVGQDESSERKPSRRRAKQFVVNEHEWPGIKSTGFGQLMKAVNMTNKRVSATRGGAPYFQTLDKSKIEANIEDSIGSEILQDESSILQPSAIDNIKREEVVKRLEAFHYVLTALFYIKNRDLKNKKPILVKEEKERADSLHNVSERTTYETKSNIPELPPIRGGFSWNEGMPAWQKIKQENEFLATAAVQEETRDTNTKSAEARDQEFLMNLRKDFVAMQEKLDTHVYLRLRRFFRDDKEKFTRRFHALKHAPALSLGMVDVRKVDRTTRIVDSDKKKPSSKQEWYVDALEELEVARFISDERVLQQLERFETFSHIDIADEIKSMKAKLCYLTLSMPVYYVLQSEYQFAIRFIIRKCLNVQEDFFGSWFKMRFKKGKAAASA